VSSFAIAMPMGVALVASPASADEVIEVEYVPPVTLLPEVDEGGDGGSGSDGGGSGGENPTWILEPPTTFPVPEDEILTDEEKAAGEKAYAEGAGVLVVQPDPDVVRAAFNPADHVRIDSFECEAGTVRAGGPASTCTLTVSSLAREFTDEVRDWFAANAGNFSVEPGTGFTIVEQGTCEVTGPQSCTISGIQPDWVAANANSDLAINLAYELIDRSAAGLSAYSDAGTLYPACPVLDDSGVQVTWEFEPETAIVNAETEVSVTAIPALNNGYATAWDGDVTWAHEATNLARSPLTKRDIAFTSDWDAGLLNDAVRAEAAREVKLKKSGTYLWTAVAEFSPEQRDGVPTCAGARASSTYTVDALGASDADLVFTSNAGPDGFLGLKWGYQESKDPRESAIQDGDSWVYTVPGGMDINVTDGASQWTDVLQWGDSRVGDAKNGRALGDANGAGSLRKISAKDEPSLASNLEALFQGQPAFTGKGVEDWDTSGVTRMGRMFTDAYQFNGDISKWDVSSVTDFASMFVRARAFDRDISGWVTESVKPEVRDRCFEPGEGDNQCNTTGMGAMFYGAINFDRDLSGWDVSAYSTTDGAVREVEGTRQIAFGSTSEIGKGKVATPFTDNAGWDRCQQPQFDPQTPCDGTGDDGAPIVITDEGVVEGLPNGEGDSFEITNSSGEDLWIIDSSLSVNGVSCATGCKIPAGETVSFTVDNGGFEGTLTPTSQDPTAEPEDVNQGVSPGAQQQGQGSVTPEPGVPDAAGDVVNPKAANSVVVTLDGQTAQATGGRVGVLPYGEYQVAATARSGGVVDLTVGGDGCSLQGDVLSVTQTNANCTLSTSVAETDTFEGASDVYEAATAMGTQTAALSAPASKKIKVGKTLTLAKPGEAVTNAGKKVTFTVVKGKKRCKVRTTKKGAVKLDMNKKGDCVVEASAKKVPQKYKAGKGVATYTGVKPS